MGDPWNLVRYKSSTKKKRRGARMENPAQSFGVLFTSADQVERHLFKCQVCKPVSPHVYSWWFSHEYLVQYLDDLPSSRLQKPILQPVYAFKYIWDLERQASLQIPQTPVCIGRCSSVPFVPVFQKLPQPLCFLLVSGVAASSRKSPLDFANDITNDV